MQHVPQQPMHHYRSCPGVERVRSPVSRDRGRDTHRCGEHLRTHGEARSLPAFRLVHTAGVTSGRVAAGASYRWAGDRPSPGLGGRGLAPTLADQTIDGGDQHDPADDPLRVRGGMDLEQRAAQAFDLEMQGVALALGALAWSGLLLAYGCGAAWRARVPAGRPRRAVAATRSRPAARRRRSGTSPSVRRRSCRLSARDGSPRARRFPPRPPRTPAWPAGSPAVRCPPRSPRPSKEALLCRPLRGSDRQPSLTIIGAVARGRWIVVAQHRVRCAVAINHICVRGVK